MLAFLRLSSLLFITLLCNAGATSAQEFNFEDEHLSPLPPRALTAVRAHAKTTDYRECAEGGFVGASVDLSGSGQKSDWVAMTADGCAWGASSAVIWVLRKHQKTYQVVLYSGGSTLNLQKAKSHSLHDLEINGGTAGYYTETTFKFDGKRYQQIKTREVNLQSPEECKRNPDVCSGAPGLSH
jgi:hypothetical protein